MSDEQDVEITVYSVKHVIQPIAVGGKEETDQDGVKDNE